MALLVLRSVTTAEFGAFTVAITTYFVALYLCRAFCGDTQVVRYSYVAECDWKYSTRAATGLALVIGIVAGAFILLAASFVGGTVRQALVPVGILLPGLLLQDTWRYAFFARGTPADAFFNDLVWVVAQIGLVSWALFSAHDAVGALIFVWGLSGVMAGIFGLFQARMLPRPALAWHWLSTHRDLGPRFAAEFIIIRGSTQLLLFLIGAMSGLRALGILNASRTVLGPYNVIALGAVGFAVPEGARVWREQPRRLGPALRVFSGAFAAIAVVCSAIVLLLPTSLGITLIGPSWPATRTVLPFMAIFLIAEGATQGAIIGLRVLAAARASLTAQSIEAPIILVAGVLGAWWDGARGAALGLAVSNSIGAVIWWRTFERTYRAALTDQKVAPTSS